MTGGAAAGPARVVVDLDLPGPRISRHVYGHFAEHLGRCVYGGFWVGEDSAVPNDRGIRLDVVQALRALRIPNLRWPGGCFADEYHWRDGVGPREERPLVVNSHWGDVVENNHFGTHEFMHLCELLGAEPYVNGNVGSGTVREMSQWVEYLTRPGRSPMADLRRSHGRDEPWTVPFWGLGNEAWGCGGNLRPEAYADLALRYATFARDHGGNRVYRIAAGGNGPDYAWTEALMTALGPSLAGSGATGPFQGISFHHYTHAGDWDAKGSATDFDTDAYAATLRNALRIEEFLTRHSTVMDRHDPGRRVGLVLDEWGTWWDVEPGTHPGFLFQQNTLRDALVAAVHFDAFHRHAGRLVLAAIAQTVNVLQAVLHTDPRTDELVLTPTYHVFEMNVGHHDADSLTAHVLDPRAPEVVARTGVPPLSASASTTGGTALVSLSNLDAREPRHVVLDLRGRTVTEHHVRLLTAADAGAANTADRPDAVAPTDVDDVAGHPRGLLLELPPHSYATVALTLGPA